MCHFLYFCATLLYFCTNLAKKATYFTLCCQHFDDTSQKNVQKRVIRCDCKLVALSAMRIYQNDCSTAISFV